MMYFIKRLGNKKKYNNNKKDEIAYAFAYPWQLFKNYSFMQACVSFFTIWFCQLNDAAFSVVVTTFLVFSLSFHLEHSL